MSTSDRELNGLYQILRILRDKNLTAPDRIDRLYYFLFNHENFWRRQFELTVVGQWNQEALSRGMSFAEEITVQYASIYYDPRVIPVTYYQRERRVRRHLDHLFSLMICEWVHRQKREFVSELVTLEPIYFLKQMARQKDFPKARNKTPHLETLRSRFHLALSRQIEP